jgi:hypothetical protein
VTQTLTTADALLKDVYRGLIVEQINQETYMLDKVEQKNGNEIGSFQGRRLVFAIHMGRNLGRGVATDGGVLATAGQQSYLNGYVGIHYYDGGIEITDLLVAQSESDVGAFTRGLNSEMDGALTDMKKQLTQSVYQNAGGILANWVSGTGTGSAVTIVVDSGQYIHVGDTVDLLTASSGAVKVTGATVTNVVFNGTADSATQTQAQITLSTVTSAGASGDALYISGTRGNATEGLSDICSTGRTLHGINSSTYPIWNSNVLPAGQSDPSEDIFIQLAQQARYRSAKNMDTFLSSLGVQRRLARTYVSQKRYNDAQATKIEGGYSAIYVTTPNGAVPVVADVDAPYGTAYGLEMSSYSWAEVRRPDWLSAPDGKGSVLHLKDGATAGTKETVWQAWITWPCSLVNEAPNRSGVITGLNDDIPNVLDQ